MSVRSAVEGAADALRRGLDRVPPVLLALIGIGVALRVAVWAAVSPTSTNLLDAGVYVEMANHELFSDPVRPVGYSLFLRAAHLFSDEIWWTMALQNLLGIATACLLYATVRRIGAPVWAGAIAAAAILLSLDQAYLEHIFLAEALFTFLLVAVLYCAVRALDEPASLRGALASRHLWLLAAGIALGLSAWVRNAGAPLIPFLALWVAVAIPGGWWPRLGRALLAGGAAAAVLVAYFAINEASSGHFGLTKVSGRVLYGRVAQFADCSKFDPPGGTEILCDQTPPDDRPGPDYYMWDASSVAIQDFGILDTDDDARLGEFAREAIVAQPLDYAEAVGRDFLRNFIPGFNDERPYGGNTYDFMRLDTDDVNAESTYAAITEYYDEEPYVERGLIGTVSDAQGVLRVLPILIAIATVLGVAGLWAGRGRERAGLALLLGASLLLLLIPTASITYNARYAVPIGGPIVAAGAIGAWLLLARRRAMPPTAPANVPDSPA